jgi:hypothetical protein
MNTRSELAIVLALSLVLTLAACSGGGGGGGAPTQAITVTDKVSVVEPKLSSSVAALRIAAAVAADSDYNMDVTNIYVEERSVQGFKTINDILCMIGQTKYDTMLNKGAYIALVDQNKCSSAKSDASSAGTEAQDQSSGSGAPKYMKWVVNVTRAHNNAPEYLHAWIHEDARESEPAKVIFANMEITEGKSDTNPVGIFVVNYRAFPDTNPLGAEIFKGYLKAEKDATGKVLLKIADTNTMWSAQEQATLDKSTDGTAGKGVVHTVCTHPSNSFNTTMNIAYDTNYFRRTDGVTDICLDRNKVSQSAWSYGLYNNATGARINRDSGFSINTKADGTGNYGWVGYWGVWLDSKAGPLTKNQTVYNIDYQTKTSTAYSVFLAGGKLKKHTKKPLTLGGIKGIPMDFWEPDLVSGGSGTHDRVVWDATALKFNKVAYMSCTTNN